MTEPVVFEDNSYELTELKELRAELKRLDAQREALIEFYADMPGSLMKARLARILTGDAPKSKQPVVDLAELFGIGPKARP